MNFIKLTALTVFVVITATLFAQDFEGVIEFRRINYYDTTNYTYHISSDQVKIDEYNKDGKVTGTMLVNLNTQEVLAVNHDRKLYMNIESKPSVKDLSNSKIEKTQQTKKVLGYDCVKWTVDNPDYKSKAEYWVVKDGNYSYFKRLLTALNRKDKIALYFMQVPGNAGFFPIIGEEKGYDGKLRARLETKKVTKKKLSTTTFNIPAGYTEFKNK
ncbi:MAG: DUF4412 domain-containing protein [Vicingus serpentipes]|nr:DUF4412 domain-containing protein [Vicingus serpentipes]